MGTVETNERFDRLTNIDIATHYSDREYYFMRGDFLGAFAYWATAQSPYIGSDITDVTDRLSNALSGFNRYISQYIESGMPKKFTYDELLKLINEDAFEKIPEVKKLNYPKIDSGTKYVAVSRYSKPETDHDFIDLGALSKNVFFMMLREEITHGI